jgi:RHS repeat-associated protein
MYLRDHTGKEVAIYDMTTGKMKSFNLYGAGLIGIVNIDDNLNYQKYMYIKDHLGSIRLTLNDYGSVENAYDYYPYGEVNPEMSFSNQTDSRYKFTEKERDLGTNYDYFGSRYYDSELGRWQSVDPMAAKYPGWSPYNYCLNNPLISIDPNGKDWYYQEDETGGYVWDPDVHSQEDMDKRGIKGKYKAKRFSYSDKKYGERTYRLDGTIMFGNETKAYNFMWDRAVQHNRENEAYILSDKVLVLPDNINLSDEGFRTGNPSNHFYTDEKEIIGLIHTHQEYGSNWSPEDKKVANAWGLTVFELYNKSLTPVDPRSKESKYSDVPLEISRRNLELIDRIKYNSFKK